MLHTIHTLYIHYITYMYIIHTLYTLHSHTTSITYNMYTYTFIYIHIYYIHTLYTLHTTSITYNMYTYTTYIRYIHYTHIHTLTTATTYPSIKPCAYSWNITSCLVSMSKTLSKVKALSLPSTTCGSPAVTDVHTLQLSIFSLGSCGRILQYQYKTALCK